MDDATHALALVGLIMDAAPRVLAVAVGGAAGAAARYLLTGAVQSAVGGTFPAGTLVVNVLGAAALGFLAATLTGPLLVPEYLRLALTIGFLGGFTTFSTFAFETVSLGNTGNWNAAWLNVALNNVLALVAAWVGFLLARRLYGVA